MGYRSLIRKNSFQTSLTGDRLFFPYGPLSRPHIIPDASTEERVLNKWCWIQGLSFGFITVTMVLVISSTHPAFWHLPCFLALIVASEIGCGVAIRTELSGLQRADTRSSFKAFYGNRAQEFGYCLAALLIFITANSLSTLFGRYNPIVDWLCDIGRLVSFILCGTVLYLSRKRR
jgi:hypothetical protein